MNSRLAALLADRMASDTELLVNNLTIKCDCNSNECEVTDVSPPGYGSRRPTHVLGKDIRLQK